MSVKIANKFPCRIELLAHDIILLKHYNTLSSNALEFLKADIKKHHQSG